MTQPCEVHWMTAADWLQRVNSDSVTDEELEAWLQWCAESSEHERAFDEVQSLYQKLREAPREYQEALRSVASQPAVLKPGFRGWIGGARSLRLAAAALVLLSIAGALVWQGWPRDPLKAGQSFATVRGEHRTLTLADGSTVVLGGESSIEARFTDAQRVLLLLGGEAYFDVKRDPSRPFVVQADNVLMTAVGTAFDVQRGKDRVTVAVMQGVVDVKRTRAPSHALPVTPTEPTHAASLERTRLNAGERIVVVLKNPVSANSELPKATPVDPAAVTAWRNGQLLFSEEPLKVVIENVNRYAHRQVVIGDASIGEMTYTGTVLRDGADEWILNLPQVFPLRVVPVDDGKVVLVAQPK